MINLNETIETTTTYIPPFILHTYKYHNCDFYINTVGFKEMYVNKYDGKCCKFSLHPSKVEVIQ